jgi:hypothetical protein
MPVDDKIRHLADTAPVPDLPAADDLMARATRRRRRRMGAVGGAMVLVALAGSVALARSAGEGAEPVRAGQEPPSADTTDASESTETTVTTEAAPTPETTETTLGGLPVEEPVPPMVPPGTPGGVVYTVHTASGRIEVTRSGERYCVIIRGEAAECGWAFGVDGQPADPHWPQIARVTPDPAVAGDDGTRVLMGTIPPEVTGVAVELAAPDGRRLAQIGGGGPGWGDLPRGWLADVPAGATVTAVIYYDVADNEVTRYG